MDKKTEKKENVDETTFFSMADLKKKQAEKKKKSFFKRFRFGRKKNK